MKGKVMTPEDEEMTMEQAHQRIERALGGVENINASRNTSLWPDDRRYSAYMIVNFGPCVNGVYADGVTIHVQAPTLAAALTELVARIERHGENLRAIVGGTDLAQATTQEHQEAYAIEGYDS